VHEGLRRHQLLGSDGAVKLPSGIYGRSAQEMKGGRSS
jgi:hypothetical protein